MRPEHIKFPRIPRFSRDIIITEKIDGTNGCIYIGEDETIFAGSRNRWLTPNSDNHGFAQWVHSNKEELLKLGTGYHYGEWWGNGIQRGYNLPNGDKRFSLFNVSRWNYDNVPKCCDVVPILYQGCFNSNGIEYVLGKLETWGSIAAPGYIDPEGIVIFHTASGHLYKKTIANDEGKNQ